MGRSSVCASFGTDLSIAVRTNVLQVHEHAFRLAQLLHVGREQVRWPQWRASMQLRTAGSIMFVAYLAPEYGGLTSTFVYREVAALRAMGVCVLEFGTRPPSGTGSDEAESSRRRTTHLYGLPRRELAQRVLRVFTRKPKTAVSVLSTAVADAVQASVPRFSDRVKLIGHFFYACAFADLLEGKPCDRIHAHFAHVPASIAMYAALMRGCPFSFTCHANDIFERPTALAEKCQRASFVACISDYNRQYLRQELGVKDGRFVVVRCGLDLAQHPRQARCVSKPGFQLLTVCRLVPKKGINVLLRALARLRQKDVNVHLTVAGDGPMMETLQQMTEALELNDCVTFLGSQPQEKVRKLYREADAFVLPCVQSKTGDRDGIPVVLMEAMAAGLPVVSTRLSGIPELVLDEYSGLLVEPEDDHALADALSRLVSDAHLRERLSRAARECLEADFDSRLNARRLLRLLAQTPTVDSDADHVDTWPADPARLAPASTPAPDSERFAPASVH